MSEININKMVEMAQPRANWETNGIAYKQEGGSYEVVWYQNGDQECGVGRVYELDDAQFIEQAPRAILALHQQVQDLQAANAALQAQVGAWQGVDSPPELEDRGFGMSRTPTLQILVQTTGRMERLTDFPEDKPDWLYKGMGEVVGWRPLPDESPTTESEE